MLIDVLQARLSPGKRFEFDEFYNLNNDILDIHNAKFVNPVEVKGNYYFNNKTVFVNAKIIYTIEFLCDRCAEKVNRTYKIDLCERFVKTQEDDAYLYDKDIINPQKAIEDNIILSLPIEKLCSPDCKGLCKICGTNLNKSKCDCDSEITVKPDNPFQILQNLELGGANNGSTKGKGLKIKKR